MQSAAETSIDAIDAHRVAPCIDSEAMGAAKALLISYLWSIMQRACNWHIVNIHPERSKVNSAKAVVARTTVG